MIDIFQLHDTNPNKRDIAKITDRLRKGEIFIFPTDTIYALGCIAGNKKGLDRIIKITGKKAKQTNLSIICRDLSMVSDYTLPMDNRTFKALKRCLPGPFTFILSGNKEVQKYFKGSKKEIGIRIPDSEIIHAILEEINEPIISTSLNKEDVIQPYFTDPEDIATHYQHSVDIMIDGGYGSYDGSTVVFAIDGSMEILREGAGDINLI
ncbi:MAG: threonylcarbamoyl-AMP synthase [Flavobacteriaceae bacterium]|nr:threonylcarbamoyl-AMP synthase [Flavobacteriaceae bacterium]